MFENLQKQKDQFFADHNVRMTELNAALNGLNKIETNCCGQNGICETLAENSKALDDLLASL